MILLISTSMLEVEISRIIPFSITFPVKHDSIVFPKVTNIRF